MKNKNVLFPVVALIVVGMLSANAPAVYAEGGYVGFGYGKSTMKAASTALIGTSFDDEDGGLKIFGGFEVNKNFALEIGYTDFGKFTGSIGGTNIDNWDASGISLSAVGFLPIENFSLFGKLGFTSWSVEDRIPLVGYSADESGTDMNYGIGGQFNFNKNFSLRFEWERFTDVGVQSTTGKSDIDVVSLNAVFKL